VDNSNLIAGRDVDDQALRSGLFALTFSTGLIDAVSFIAFGHVFTANMTGNIVFMAFAFAGVPGLSIPRSATSLGAFIIGAAIGGILNQKVTSELQSQWIKSALAIEAVFLGGAAAVSFGLRSETIPSPLVYFLIVPTAIAMGVRNAVVRKLAFPDLTTTVLTLTVTGLASDSFVDAGMNPKWKTRFGAILMMFAGAFAGALMLRYGPFIPLTVSAAVPVGVIVLLMVGSRTLHGRDKARA